MTARIYSLDPIHGYIPVTLSGHRNSLVGVYFAGEGDVIYTVSKDAATFVWEWMDRDVIASDALAAMGEGEEAAPRAPRKITPASSMLASRSRFHEVPDPAAAAGSKDYSILSGEWRLLQKHFFMQEHAKVCVVDGGMVCCHATHAHAAWHAVQVYSSSFHSSTGLLVVGFSSGIFGIYTMPDCTLMHTLSISQHRIHASAINSTGEWLAFGSRTLGQLLVWEWRSESCKSMNACFRL